MIPVLLLPALLALLDGGTLLRVEINPEARVKVARGPAHPALAGETIFLVRVDNAAGVTALLNLRSPNVAGDDGDRDRWLRLALTHLDGAPPRLSGARREWLRLALSTAARGKREAAFALDIGQGTQDLGFRAEVFVLFDCEEKTK